MLLIDFYDHTSQFPIVRQKGNLRAVWMHTAARFYGILWCDISKGSILSTINFKTLNDKFQTCITFKIYDLEGFLLEDSFPKIRKSIYKKKCNEKLEAV